MPNVASNRNSRAGSDHLSQVAGALLVLCVALWSAIPAGANQPRHVDDSVALSYPLPYYTKLCGFPVTFGLVGPIDSLLFFDAGGAVVREVDTQPGAVNTFSSPFRSFSFPFASALRTTYTAGAAVGSAAIATGDGLAGKVPGIPADAGQISFNGVVVDVTPAGIPIVGFTNVRSTSGHSNDPALVDAAICASLAP